jgi:DNA-binding response OmpR family regulator
MSWHILMVDDDADILRLVSSALGATGFKVSTLNDPLNALSEIERIQPNLVILDVEMPGKSGLELCADIRLRPNFKELPIVFLTSRSEAENRIRGMQLGAVDYVMKPFQLKDLILRIRAVLAVGGDWKSRASQRPPVATQATTAAAPAEGLPNSPPTAQVATSAPVATEHPAHGKDDILVIDDDEHIQKLLELFLREKGYRVRIAGDGLAGLQAIEKRVPDLVILDVLLPKMNGFEVLRSIRANPATKDLYVLMLTAKTMESDVIRGTSLGSTDYVLKPFSPLELVAKINQLLRNAP